MNSLGELVDKVARSQPDRAAIRASDGELSYDELRRASVARAAALAATGIGTGERVALRVSPTTLAVVDAIALARLRASVLLVDGQANGLQTHELLRRFRARALVSGGVELLGGTTRVTTKQPYLVLATSGTTGVPRLVARRWPDAICNASRFAEAAALTAADRVVLTTPLHHSYAFGAGLLATLSAGGTVEIGPERPNPTAFWRSIEGGASVVLSVPFLWRWFLRAHPPTSSRPRLAVAAGEPLEPSLAERAVATGMPLTPHYGTTETAAITFGEPGETPTVGRGLRGTQVRCDDAGMLQVRSPGTSPWLVGDRKLTAEVFRAGWITTGDRGRITSDGRVTVLGRADSIVKIGGRRVDPLAIEHSLRTVTGVDDCAVVARVGPRGLTELHAFIAGTIDPVELRRVAARRLSPNDVPSSIRVIPEVPRNRSGKIVRGLLPR